MKVTEIARVPVVVDGISQISEELSQKSTRLLGYAPHRNRIYGALTALFKAANIEPLDRTSVERYKAEKVHRGLSTHQKVFAVWGVSVLTAACLVMAIFGFNGRLWATWALGTGLGIVASIILNCFKPDIKETAKWERVPLSSFNGYVPEFVLAKAVALMEAGPYTPTLFVDVLNVTREYVVKPADPFLVAVLNKEIYYLDVWDEPEFERRTR